MGTPLHHASSAGCYPYGLKLISDQIGDLDQVAKAVQLPYKSLYAKSDLEILGKSLDSQAMLTGKITDLGTNIDMHLTLTDVVTGEVISSATQHLTRTKFAVEMLRQQ